MKKILVLLALLVTLQLLVGDNTRNWELQYTSAVEQLQMLRQSAGMIYGVGYKYFVKSTDGVSFQNIMVADVDSLRLLTVYMVTSSLGYCGGYIDHQYEDGKHPILYKTTNGGQNWFRTGLFENYFSSLGQCYYLSNIQFVSSQEGYLVLNVAINGGYNCNPEIWRTTNSGQSWQLVYNQIDGQFYISDFSYELKIIQSSYPNGVLVSNNGTDWQFYEGQHNSLIKVSENRIIGGYGDFKYSDDLGLTWTLSDTSLLGTGFYADTGPTNSDVSIRTGNVYANGGLSDGNWSRIGIVKSIDNGASWDWAVLPEQMPDQSRQMYGIVYADDDYIYIAFNLKIYRMYVGSPVVANDDPTAPVVSETINCYPNPFRGSTNITIKQIDNSLTTVAIYNLRGQLIRTVVNNLKLSPGEHSFTWDGRTNSGQAAAAGIYFFKMISGKYSATRKMLLLR